MSVGELLNIYRDGDLDIHPEFQRFFRWSAAQKSRFIESLLLGIPIPSIFVHCAGHTGSALTISKRASRVRLVGKITRFVLELRAEGSSSPSRSSQCAAPPS